MRSRGARAIKIVMGWVAIVLLLSACAVRTPVETAAEPVNPELLKGTTLVIRDFSTTPYVANGEAAMSQCKSSAHQYLSSKGLFKAVDNDAAKIYDAPVLFVDAKLVDLRIVSKSARFWGGALSGRSHMKVHVEIYDVDGKPVAEKELFGAPNAVGAAWSFGASDTKLPFHMGRLLGDYVVSEAGRIEP